jgi:hypothetical protein
LPTQTLWLPTQTATIVGGKPSLSIIISIITSIITNKMIIIVTIISIIIIIISICLLLIISIIINIIIIIKLNTADLKFETPSRNLFLQFFGRHHGIWCNDV